MENVLRLSKQSIKKNKISKKGVAQKLSGGRSGAKGSKRAKKVVKNRNSKPQLKFKKNGNNFSSSEPAKLKISNLDFGVTADDLLELFSDFGTLKSTSLNKDKSGKSYYLMRRIVLLHMSPK